MEILKELMKDRVIIERRKETKFLLRVTKNFTRFFKKFKS